MKNIERKEGKRRTVGRFALEIRGIISIVGRKKRILRPGARSTFNPLSRALSPFNVNCYASVNKYRYRGESAATISRGGKRFLNGRGRNEILICNFSLLLPFSRFTRVFLFPGWVAGRQRSDEGSISGEGWIFKTGAEFNREFMDSIRGRMDLCREIESWDKSVAKF